MGIKTLSGLDSLSSGESSIASGVFYLREQGVAQKQKERQTQHNEDGPDEEGVEDGEAPPDRHRLLLS